ncbi:restriction endonuclease subunit S [Jeotgalibacillus malaysiensis]|uniref:restriction endonuclease subunit S n=1 Tax=Jeotgalibacillus malaysiensis TaxID=1508404 RepID=UPI00384C7D17
MNAPKLRFKDHRAKWNEIILNDFFYFIDGDRGKNYPNENDFLPEGYCLFLNAHNISDTGLTFKNTNWLTKEKHASLRKGTAEYRDLILTTRGSKLGKLAVYDETIPYNVVRINSAMLLIRQKQAIDLEYTLYLFKDAILPKFINQHIVGSAQPHLTVKDLKAYSTYIPEDVIEQQKIGYFFSLLNSKIQKQQEKIEKLEELKKGMMQKIFSQEIRFKDEDGEEFPKWNAKRLSDTGQVVTGNTPSKSIDVYWSNPTIPWITPTDINDSKEILDSASKLSDIGYKKARQLPANTLLVTCIASIGKNAILKVDGSCNQQINGIIPNENHYVDFLYYLIEHFNYRIKNVAGRTATALVNKTTFENLSFLIPAYKEQNVIAKFLSKLDIKIEKEKEKLLVFEKQKKGFMQRMFV